MSTYSAIHCAKNVWAIKENCFQFHRRLFHSYDFFRTKNSSTIASSSLLCSKLNYRTNCQHGKTSNLKAHYFSSWSSSSSTFLFLQSHTHLQQLLPLKSRSVSTAPDANDNKSESSESNLVALRTLTSDRDDADLEDYDEDLLERQEIWDIAPATRPSYSFAPFANDSDVIKKLVHLDVKLYKWETKPQIAEFILKLDFDKDIAPYVRFLVDHGVDPAHLGAYLTANPLILKEQVENLEKRIAYLRSKNFDEDSIGRIVTINRQWLMFTTKEIDKCLGFFQEFFGLKGTEVRRVATVNPRLITHSMQDVKNVAFTLKERAGFEDNEIKMILLDRPGIFRKTTEIVWSTFDYIHNKVKFSHEQILRSPMILATNVTRLQHRIGFLQKLGRAQFDPTKPNYVSIPNIALKDDATFAVQVAHSSTLQYNNYLKTL